MRVTARWTPESWSRALSLRLSPLDSLHRALGARMVDFAGWSMPVQYPAGTLAEHAGARGGAAMFDVSHMAQASLPAAAASGLERLVPGDILGLAEGRQRYTMFLNAQGGILDDIMVARYPDRLFLVLNAARADFDLAHLRGHGLAPDHHADRALLALQGPLAAAVMGRLAPGAAALPFLGVAACDVAGLPCWVSRSGYTGEDGFEISVPAAQGVALAERLLAEPEVSPAGLAARDTLRLEAGLCLYGSDIDEATTPVEAALGWSIGRRRREQGGFPGAAVIAAQLAQGPARLRVGIRPLGRAPARAGTAILGADGKVAGKITSGTFSPTLGAPIAMGYVDAGHAAIGTPLILLVRGQRVEARVSATQFVPHRFAGK